MPERNEKGDSIENSEEGLASTLPFSRAGANLAATNRHSVWVAHEIGALVKGNHKVRRSQLGHRQGPREEAIREREKPFTVKSGANACAPCAWFAKIGAPAENQRNRAAFGEKKPYTLRYTIQLRLHRLTETPPRNTPTRRRDNDARLE